MTENKVPLTTERHFVFWNFVWLTGGSISNNLPDGLAVEDHLH